METAVSRKMNLSTGGQARSKVLTVMSYTPSIRCFIFVASSFNFVILMLGSLEHNPAVATRGTRKRLVMV